ncbi:Ketosamine-3-kinase [Lachnellula arida]|uniref:protein-ribulosamine 3-kinase n=1 Tax=Lachnellula arida TaxID=1316785 RepID=A0A8T9B700_9HELO|nr:Ketosamine-3-kinase [Lachnellula arida]
MADLEKVQLWKDSDAENAPLDQNVVAYIPEASEASRLRTMGHGASYWTNTACVSLDFPDGRESKYFLKIATGERGRRMMEGEYESMKVIHQVTPIFAPKPIAWGTYKSNPDIHFFLCDFHEMDDELPEISKFTESLAKLHRDSVSPTGRFGFHITTYNGNIPQDVRWTDTWEECFANGTRQDFDLEAEARGTCDELEALRVPLFEKVIPRFLRPLETGGRSLKPSFVHGDLWYGNSESNIVLRFETGY